MKLMITLTILTSALSLPNTATAATYACAHRGDIKCAPENTLPAFKLAVQKRAPMIEFDVYVTKDERLVIIHDNTVDRTTNGKGQVTELTFEEIRKLDAGSWFDPKFAGTKIPTLRETLEVIPKTILCNVHLKSGPGLAAKTAKTLEEMGRIDHCFLACSVEQIKEARAVVPKIKTCNMSRQGSNRRAYMDTTFEIGAEFIQLHFGNGTEHLKAEVAELHGHGVTVNWFGAQNEALIRTLAEADVDYILTNDLDLCINVLVEHCVKPMETGK